MDFLARLCEALAQDSELIFVTSDNDFLERRLGPSIAGVAKDIISPDEARRRSAALRRKAIELIPHESQDSIVCDRSVLACHGLEAFCEDPGGGSIRRQREALRARLRGVTAVMAHLPMTYFSLEQAAGLIINNLFPTESPLIVDARGHPGEGDHPKSVPDAVEILYPAGLRAGGNHETLVRAVAALEAKGTSFRLIFAGPEGDGEKTNALKSLVHQLDVGRRIEFAGPQSNEELRQMYRRCDAVIAAGAVEGGACVAFEAIAAGKPVAANILPAARLHLQSVGGRAIWFDAGSIDSAAQAISQLVGSESKHWRSVNSAARAAINTLSWEGVAQKWRHVFQFINGKTRRPIVRLDNYAGRWLYNAGN